MKAAPRGFGLLASVALHGVVAALLILWPVAEEFSANQTQAQGVAVIYEGAPEVGVVESPAAPPELAAVPPAPEPDDRKTSASLHPTGTASNVILRHVDDALNEDIDESDCLIDVLR